MHAQTNNKVKAIHSRHIIKDKKERERYLCQVGKERRGKKEERGGKSIHPLPLARDVGLGLCVVAFDPSHGTANRPCILPSCAVLSAEGKGIGTTRTRTDTATARRARGVSAAEGGGAPCALVTARCDATMFQGKNCDTPSYLLSIAVQFEAFIRCACPVLALRSTAQCAMPGASSKRSYGSQSNGALSVVLAAETGLFRHSCCI